MISLYKCLKALYRKKEKTEITELYDDVGKFHAYDNYNSPTNFE
jgi:hypothetical protein